jgi:hypothetical protein
LDLGEHIEEIDFGHHIEDKQDDTALHVRIAKWAFHGAHVTPVHSWLKPKPSVLEDWLGSVQAIVFRTGMTHHACRLTHCNIQ